jgi:hypothetical protein
MKHETNSPSSSNGSRCRHFTVNGRQCRLRVLDTRSGLCFRHLALSEANGAGTQRTHSDSEDLSPELLPQLSEFESAADVKEFLARLLLLVTKGRVTPRRASVLAYITNQLLHSHSAFYREIHAKDDEPQQWIMDLPRPRRDDPVPPSHPNMDWLAPAPTSQIPRSPHACPERSRRERRHALRCIRGAVNLLSRRQSERTHAPDRNPRHT